MKMRIKGNSLRLRVSRSDIAQLMRTGRIQESIRFAPEAAAKLTYALEYGERAQEISAQYGDCEIRVLLSTEAARRWANGDGVGIYGAAETGGVPLELIVEKDYACIDRADADNADAFPNPKAEALC
jgi:hypothetical protein